MFYMRVIKRNGEEVPFDLSKIVNAVTAANNEVDNIYRLNEYQIQAIADNVANKIKAMKHVAHVEDIQDLVETSIMEMRGYEVAQKYVRYRYKRDLARKSN
ncbi:MAG: anaerobic ribonucleoside-triphosphate reductase, partial [Clostridia bacterium]|nr:anaerobic ribonucleoside-triphosphate reductase [Clostridia bacterium]